MTPELIIAADVQDDIALDLLVKETHEIPGVLGYKIGANLAILYGLKYISSIIYQHTGSKMLMYDHQKAGIDLPHVGEKFMWSVRRAGFDSVILFPTAGAAVQREWTKAARNEGLVPIIGGKMTHWTMLDLPNPLPHVGSPYYWDVYQEAALGDVKEFVIPGNITASAAIAKYLDNQSFIIYTPGMGAQGGTMEFLKILNATTSARIIPIVGRLIYEAADMGEAVQNILTEMEQE